MVGKAAGQQKPRQRAGCQRATQHSQSDRTAPRKRASRKRACFKQSRSLRHYLTTLSSEFSSPIDVEIAAAYLDEQAKSLGLTLRASANRNSSGASRGPAMSRSMEQLSELVGSVSLKDLVRESTDVIERLCIEAALVMTKDNRASAAEMLGLSRQSLYTKLRRYGLAEYENNQDLSVQSD
ncbi:MAG: hypothetical protein EBV92_05030 [Betaproteobacteria bacterium]|nr:hypothetical protein [Betaproteobacteria bacterium]